MKTLNLDSYQVRELQPQEAAAIIGGGWWADFKAGFVRGWNSFWDSFAEFYSAYSEVFD